MWKKEMDGCIIISLAEQMLIVNRLVEIMSKAREALDGPSWAGILGCNITTDRQWVSLRKITGIAYFAN